MNNEPRFMLIRQTEVKGVLDTTELNQEINKKMEEIEDYYRNNNGLMMLYFKNAMLKSNIQLLVYGDEGESEDILDCLALFGDKLLKDFIKFLLDQKIGLLNMRDLLFMWNGMVFDEVMSDRVKEDK